MAVVVIRAHYFGDLRHYDGHDIYLGLNIHVCCHTCGDHCWWAFSGLETRAELEAHINEFHSDATLVFSCDINGAHNRFDTVSDFIDHLRMY